MQVELAQLRYRLPRLRGRGYQLSQQGAGIGTRGPGETQLEVDRRRILRRDARSSSATSTAWPRPRDTQRKARSAATLSHRRARRLHERGQVDAAQPAHRRRRARRGPAVLHARPDHAPAAPARRRDRAALRHRRVRPAPAAPARRGVPVDARGGRRRRPAGARGRRQPPDAEEQIAAVRHRAARDRRRRRCPSCSCSTRPTSPTPDDVKALLGAHPDAVVVSGGHRRRRDRALGHDRRPAAGARPIVELLVPYDRGDVLAALHREGEVLVEVHDEGGTRVRARIPGVTLSRFDEFVVPRRP